MSKKSKKLICKEKPHTFIEEPIMDKPVTELSGIGEILGERLKASGFDRAYVVLGQFLVLKKNKGLFTAWFKDVCGANNSQAKECYECLADWCNEFL